MANRVVHFEIQADDVARAREFYGSIFGWEFEEWKDGDTEYWMVMTAEKDSKELGINGGLLQRNGPRPEKGQSVNAFVCTLQVDDYDATAKKILEAGGKEAVAKVEIAGMAWQGYYIDTEGNIFGIHQPFESGADRK